MTMLERVARAMDTVTTGPAAGDLVISEIFSAELWRMMSGRLARAAIEAMREPTEEMCLASAGAVSFGEDAGSFERIEGSTACWQAMLDAALGEKT